MHVDGQQWILRRALRFHREGNWHGDRQIVLLVVDVDLPAEIAPLAALADDDDTGVVQDRRSRQGTIRTQYAYARQGSEVVALLRRQPPGKSSHAPGCFGCGLQALTFRKIVAHRNRQESQTIWRQCSDQ